MFDRIMENSMALWMLASALFPIFFFGTLIKAILHYRRTRKLLEYIPRPPVPRTRFQTDDWVPSP
jgi:hypothetical protein